MGQGYSYAIEHIEQQFVHVQQLTQDEQPRRNILYNELLQIEMPDDLRVNLKHIAVLFCLDANRDGAFSYDDLIAFAMWLASTMPKDISGDEFHDAVQARCVLKLWQVCRERGNTVFVEWLCGFLSRSHPAPVRKPLDEVLPNVVVEDDRGQCAQSVAPPAPAVDPLHVDDSASSDDGEDFSHLNFCAAAPELPRREELFGNEAVRTLYVLTNVSEGYGLDFLSFSHILRGDLVSSKDFAGEMTAVAQSRSSICSATSSVPSHEPLLHGAHVRAFLSAFIESYWSILTKLGLELLIDDDQQSM